jgi:hypothetical protein
MAAVNLDFALGALNRIAGARLMHAALFFLFVICGSLYIVAAKALGLGQLLVTSVPVLFMLGYAALIGMARALRMRDDQSGDNLYYMGFLFTLASLAVSLYQFSASNAAEEIVPNFGVAIATTIVGIALRVFFSQLRQDPVEVERVARLELAEAARRVRRELDSTVVEFSFFRRSTQQVLMEAFAGIQAKVDEVGTGILSGLEDNVRKCAEPLEAVSKNSGEAIQQLASTAVTALQSSGRELRLETERLGQSAVKIASSLEGVSSKLQAMQTPERVIEISLAPAIESLSRVTGDLGAQVSAQSGGLRETLAGVQAATQASTSMADRTIGVVREAAEKLIIGGESFNGGVARHTDQLYAAVERSEAALAAVDRAISRANADQDARSVALSETVLSLQRSTASLEAALAALLRKLQVPLGLTQDSMA